MKKPNSLKKQLFWILFFSLFFMGCLAVAMNYITVKNYNTLLVNEISRNAQISAKSINDVIGQLTDTGSLLSSDNEIQYYLSERRQRSMTAAEYSTFCNVINNIYFSRRTESCIRFINILGENVQAGTYLQALADIEEGELQEMVSIALSKKGKLTFYAMGEKNKELLAVKSILEIKNLSLQHLGTLIIGVDMNKLMRQVSVRSKLSDATYLLYTQDGVLVFESEEGFSALVPQLLADDRSQVIQHKNRSYICATTQLYSTGWYYTTLVPYEQITRSRNFYLLLFIITAILSLVVLFWISKKMVQTRLEGFEHLIVYMRRGKVGFKMNEKTKQSFSTSQEINEIFRQFQDMADKINDLIYDNYEMQLKANQYQIQALSAQISPHFLYNTLDTINWQAKASKLSNISEMAEALGKILHQTLSNQVYFFTIEEELTVVKYFLSIQKLRYQNSIDFQAEVEDAALTFQIPRLTLQPIVENAIQEAMRDISPVCSIQVQIRFFNQMLLIRVCNSGSVFEEDFEKRFYKNQLLPHGFGVGLRNIEQRLRLCYGGDFSLSFYNEDKRAVVEMKLPVKRKEKDIC